MANVEVGVAAIAIAAAAILRRARAAAELGTDIVDGVGPRVAKQGLSPSSGACRR